MTPVIFSVMAEEDLEAVADYIAVDNPRRAISFVQELRKQCMDLSRFPNSHTRFPELGREARIMPYKNYVVLYRVLDKSVIIERIINGARDILNIVRAGPV
jgi:toxin ParE1/3/4